MILQTTVTRSREALFTDLYRQAFPTVAAFVRKMGGSFDDAKDLFHDALVIYYEKIQEQALSQEHDPGAYVFGITKHLWFKKFKDSSRNVALNPDHALSVADDAEPAVSTSMLRYIELSGKKCLELLTSFYYGKLNMRELATRFGFAGERSATAQKFKCLEKVRNAMRERSLVKEDFYE